MNQLKYEIKALLIETLNLEDLKIEDIADDLTLFGEGLSLDSIDALELGLAIKAKYNITLSADSEKTQQYFHNVNALAEFIASNKA